MNQKFLFIRSFLVSYALIVDDILFALRNSIKEMIPTR